MAAYRLTLAGGKSLHVSKITPWPLLHVPWLDPNSGTETPAPVRYTTFWSACDEQIAPTGSTGLAGAVNLQTDCLKHNALLTDPAVQARVRAALTA